MVRPVVVDPEFLTTSEVARLIGVHPATVRRYADDGILRVLELPGGIRRFRRIDVQTFIDENTSPKVG